MCVCVGGGGWGGVGGGVNPHLLINRRLFTIVCDYISMSSFLYCNVQDNRKQSVKVGNLNSLFATSWRCAANKP